MKEKVTVVIPAFNEGKRIGEVIESLPDRYEVIVVDDNSDDNTAEVAREYGAEVFKNETNIGYIGSIKKGFEKANGDIIVTMDADGEHKPEDVESLIRPMREGKKDLVFGSRKKIPRPSERFLNKLAQIKVNVSDTGTGFRALRKDLASELKLDTACTCGTFALESKLKDARIGEVDVETRNVDKPRSVAWGHFIQFFHVMRYLLRC